MNKERDDFIERHSSLFWYTPNERKKEISDSLLVETILNYGTTGDVEELIEIMGMDNVAEVFFNAKGRQKQNYYPEIYNYFTLFFKRYATQRNI